MTETSNRADALRIHLDTNQPGWRDQLRADLDTLQPGWESFPLSVWDEQSGNWVDIVLLANPETVSTTTPRSWLGRMLARLGRR